jgi:GntR family transcriptional regulator / MocR family aminotransferase
MHIPLDRQKPEPLYHQIASFIRQGIQSGNLVPDLRLPSTRSLAQDLGVNRITVEAAYAELESEGLVISKVGSGAYVLPPSQLPPMPKAAPGAPWPLWQQEIQESIEPAKNANLERILKEKGPPDAISFASGVGDYHRFPAEDFRKILQTVMRRDGIAALEYGEDNGYAPLRATVAKVLSSQGLQVDPENILITAGSQQSLALVTQLLLKPGDAVLVESPTYSGALNLFKALNLKIIGIPVDEKGLQVDQLEKLLQQVHPRLLYTIPNFQNPTGTCLSSSRRLQLIALADRYNLPILEDDYVGDLRYEGRSLPSLKSLDPGGRVIYVSTFSKMLMPGLRVGFLAAEGPVYDRLVAHKRVNDLTTSNLIQRALEAYVTVGRYQVHLQRSCQVYRKRRDAMLEAIERLLPYGVQVANPQGGLFLWLRLPEGISAEALLPLALQEGVAFAPGSNFFLEKQAGCPFIRLNFAAHPPETIQTGMKRLQKAFKRLEAQPFSPVSKTPS